MNIVFPSTDIQAWAHRIYGSDKRILLTPYEIPIFFYNLDSGASQVKQTQIQSNADFVLTNIQYVILIGGASSSAVDIQVTDSATGEQFFNQAIPVALIQSDFGNMAYPRWIGGNSSLAISLKNRSSFGNTVTGVTLEGFLIRQW